MKREKLKRVLLAVEVSAGLVLVALSIVYLLLSWLSPGLLKELGLHAD